MTVRFFPIVPALFALFACAPEPAPEAARPALWEVTGPADSRAWLFGTIHALERPVKWRSPAIDTAMRQSGSVVVEVAGVGDDPGIAAIFTRLSRTPGVPPLSERVEPLQAPGLKRLFRKTRMGDASFEDVETWAAALTLSQALQPDLKGENGIDRAVLAAKGGRPVIELEGAEAQLGQFDGLPEKEQRDLLALVIRESTGPGAEDADLARAWQRGDMARIEAETRKGLLADPELRETLFSSRNRAWTERIAGLIAEGRRPFVAVGAAHMAGPEGLPAMLAARGYKVRRVQ